MGLYATVSDVTTRFDQNELAKFTGGTSVDTAMVDAVIAAVESLVNVTLAKRGYAVPVSPVPDVLKDLVCYLTIKRIYARKISVTEIPVGLREMFEWAEMFLRGLNDGSITIPGAIDPAAASIAVAAGSRPDVKTATDNEYGTS